MIPGRMPKVPKHPFFYFFFVQDGRHHGTPSFEKPGFCPTINCSSKIVSVISIQVYGMRNLSRSSGIISVLITTNLRRPPYFLKWGYQIPNLFFLISLLFISFQGSFCLFCIGMLILVLVGEISIQSRPAESPAKTHRKLPSTTR